MKILYTLLSCICIAAGSLFAQSPEKLSSDSLVGQFLNSNSAYSVDNYIYYFPDYSNPLKVWRSDGTVAGTREVMDLSADFPNAFGNMPQGFVSAGGKVFITLQYNSDTGALITFTHQDLQPTVVKLFRSVGLGGGGSSAKHLRPMMAYKNKCWFGADDFAAPVDQKGAELWSSDGTSAGTQMVADIITQGSFGFSVSSFPGNFLVWNNTLYFSALKWMGSGLNFRFVLYSTDGTTEGTQPVNNGVYSFSTTNFNPTSGQFDYKILNGKLFIKYRYAENMNQEEIIISEVAHTGLFASGNFFRFGDYEYLNGKMIVSGIPVSKGILDTIGPELYTYDENMSPASLTLVKNINTGGSFGTPPGNFKVANNTLWMTAAEDDFTTGKQLYKSNLTPAGTVRLTNYKTFWLGEHFREFELYQNKIYFNVYDSILGNELHVLNPADDSISHWNLFPGQENGVANSGLTYSTGDKVLTLAGGLLYFSGQDAPGYAQLWKIGTAMPTGVAHREKSVDAALAYPNPFNNTLFFETGQKITRVELYSVNGKRFDLTPNQLNGFNTNNLPEGWYFCRVYVGDFILGTYKLLKN